MYFKEKNNPLLRTYYWWYRISTCLNYLHAPVSPAWNFLFHFNFLSQLNNHNNWTSWQQLQAKVSLFYLLIQLWSSLCVVSVIWICVPEYFNSIWSTVLTMKEYILVLFEELLPYVDACCYLSGHTSSIIFRARARWCNIFTCYCTQIAHHLE